MHQNRPYGLAIRSLSHADMLQSRGIWHTNTVVIDKQRGPGLSCSLLKHSAHRIVPAIHSTNPCYKNKKMHQELWEGSEIGTAEQATEIGKLPSLHYVPLLGLAPFGIFQKITIILYSTQVTLNAQISSLEQERGKRRASIS